MVNERLIKDWIKKHDPNGREKLAVKAGISFSTLSRMIKLRSASAEVLRKIADAIGVPVDDLLSPKTPAA